jgi:hypothetical protein
MEIQTYLLQHFSVEEGGMLLAFCIGKFGLNKCFMLCRTLIPDPYAVKMSVCHPGFCDI